MANGFNIQFPETGAVALQKSLGGLSKFAEQQLAMQLAQQQRQADLQDKITLAEAQNKMAIKQAEAKAKIARQDPVNQFLTQAKLAEAAKTMGNEALFNQIIGGGQPTHQDVQAPSIQQPVPRETQPLQPQFGTLAPGTQPKPGDLIPGGFKKTPFGKFEPTTLERVKKTAAQEKREVETKELAGQTKNLVELFIKARKEAESVPAFGQPGIIGRAAGLGAVAKGKLGFSPTVNVFQDRIGAFATIAAKAAGEVRPTDQDIIRFSKSLTNLQNSDEENALQLEQTLKDIKVKGQSVDWAKPLVEEFEKETGVKIDFNFNKTQTNNKPIGVSNIKAIRAL